MGRLSAFRDDYVEQAHQFCLLGATDDDLARLFRVSRQTIDSWRNKHPAFGEAVQRGKDIADAKVADSLYRRANGYSHPAVKIFADAKTGSHVSVSYTEHYPPDTTACIFWLKNRQRAKWRDKVEQGYTDGDGNDIPPPETKVMVYMPDNGR